MFTTTSTPTTSEQYLLQGQRLHEQGYLEDAQQCYIRILEQHPQHCTALHLFGITLYQQTRYSESEFILHQAQALAPNNSELLTDRGAVLLAKKEYANALACFEQAILISPHMTAALNNKGIALQYLQRTLDAKASWQAVLALQPDHKDALINLGRLLCEQGQTADALEWFGQLLQYYPQEPTSWLEMAKALLQAKLYEQALHYIQQALLLSPEDPNCLSEKGSILRCLQRYAEALICYQAVAAIEPDSADADSNCGVILDDLKRHHEAAIYYQQALKKQPAHRNALFSFAVNQEKQGFRDQALAAFQQLTDQDPKHVSAWQGQADLLLHQRRLNDALGCYRRALMLDHQNADLWHGCAIVLRDMQRHWLALSCLWRAIQLRPHFASALNTHGMMLYELHQFDDAMADFQRAQELAADLTETYWNQAHCHLMQGHLLLGWQLYEWRWPWLQENAKQRQWHQPQWRGEKFSAGQTILLHAEQGYGDTIQFCRYASLVAKRGVRVILEVPSVLHDLLTVLPGIELIQRGDALPEHDWQCPLMSLPLAFATTLATIPSATGYLHLPNKNKSTSNSRPRIGFAWAGNAKHHNDRARSIPLEKFQPLLTAVAANYVCLQQPLSPPNKQKLDAFDVSFPNNPLTDFTATAAEISDLDLVITVDTAVAHLAGAMGKEVWILLAYNNDWRWMIGRNDSPWYHSARLFRQPILGDWQSVITDVAQALQHRYPVAHN